MLTRVPVPPAAERRIRREARSATLRERALALRQAGETYASIGRVLGVSLERAHQIVRKAERLARNPHWYDGLPVRAQYFLYARGLTSLDEVEAARAVSQLSRRELMHTPNFGHGACAAVIAWLACYGFKLRTESPHAFSVRLMHERKAENEEGAPATERPSESRRPVSSGPEHRARTWYPPTAS